MIAKNKVLAVMVPLLACALTCALAPAAFAAQGGGSLVGATVIAAQDEAQDISDATVEANDQTYTGAEQKPAVTVKLDDATLKAGEDYTVTYSNNVNAGTAKIVIKGKGEYSGEATGSFKINPANASGMSIADIDDKTYSGKAFTPSPKVTFKGKKLVEGTDYTVSYDDNKNAGKAKVIVKGKGNYTGTKTEKFKIEKALMSKVKVEAIGDKTYTGKAITVNLKVTYKDKKLKVGEDFTVTYKKNVDVGKAEVVLKGADNFKGKEDKNFKIVPAKIGKANMADIAARTYTGSAIQPTPALTFNGKTLKKGVDYTISYKSNVNAGTAKIIVTGKKNFTGTKKGSFKINPAALSSASLAAIPSQGYTGKPITPNPSLTFKGKTLKKDTDYTVSYGNNVNRGTANVNIVGKGNFTGTKNTTFSIVQASLSKAKISKLEKQKYTGQPIEPALNVTVAGRALVKNVDYTVAYKDNVNAGKATVTITGIGNYTGSKTKGFKIVK